MPSEVALGPISVALKALLVAHTPLTGQLAVKSTGAGGGPAVYDEGGVAQGALMPYVTIGAGVQVPFHTMGPHGSAKYGWNCTVQIKAVAQAPEATGLAILSAVVGLLYHGRELTVAGYGSAWCDEFVIQPTLQTVVAGVVTREWPGIVRVFVHD